jgi:hypothetical protein
MIKVTAIKNFGIVLNGDPFNLGLACKDPNFILDVTVNGRDYAIEVELGDGFYISERNLPDSVKKEVYEWLHENDEIIFDLIPEEVTFCEIKRLED